MSNFRDDLAQHLREGEPDHVGFHAVMFLNSLGFDDETRRLVDEHIYEARCLRSWRPGAEALADELIARFDLEAVTR